MLDNLKAIQGIKGISAPPAPVQSSGGEGGVSFADILKDKFAETNRLGLEADRSVERAALGLESSPHATLIAVQKAEISMSLLMSVKERLERAYQELVRTQF